MQNPSPPGRPFLNGSPRFLNRATYPANLRGRSPRFGTPSMRHGSGSDSSESPNKFMEIDSAGFFPERGRQSEEDRVFALSDTLSVRLAASLPIEVRQAFQTADPSKDVFAGSVHVFLASASYAVVVSVQTCFVWKIDLNSPYHLPTCYMFPVPSPKQSNPYLTIPFASLVSFGSSREPGLILVSSSGEVRFWDCISTGLSGAERFSTSTITLEENETVEGLERVDAMIYVTRTRSRLHRLTVTARPGTGKFVVVPTPFNDQEHQGTGWLNPFRILQRRGNPWDGGSIVTVVPLANEEAVTKAKNAYAREGEVKSIWVLTSKSLMVWNVNLGGGQQCVSTHEVKEIVTGAVLKGVAGDKSLLDIELLDVAVDTTGDPVLLISHGLLNSQAPSPLDVDLTPVRVFALVRLHLRSASEIFEVKGDIEVLPYELTMDPRRASSPRLTILDNFGPFGELELSFSQFSDAFAFTAVEPPYQEQLHLKNVDDMILGINVSEHSGGHDVLILTTGMILAARPETNNILKMKDDVHNGKANVLKSTIRQAMKYGIKPENPLRFQLPSIADEESLKTAAEQMSRAFLTSNPDVVPVALSVGTQLASRESSLEALVTFIGVSGGLNKLSYTTREQLLADAEKLAAARGLWVYHNEQVQKSASSSLLPLAVEAHMRRVGKLDDSDAMRTFFNTLVPSIGALVPEIVGIIESKLSLSESPWEDLYLLAQANGLVQALFTSAFRHRSQKHAHYQLSRPFMQPWTSDPILLLNLRKLFDTTVKFRTQVHTHEDGDDLLSRHNVQKDLTSQLREMASCIFRAYSDRLEFMESCFQDGGGGERERNRLEEEFCSLRPVVLNHLVRADSIEHAFKLAETYRDFHALSELSYHWSADKLMPTSQRIQAYIERFHGEFTSQLYEWYIEQGKLRLLFDSGTEFGDYIDSFFSQNPTPRLSWIHDVGKQNYQHAATALLTEAEGEITRETRHLMLSIGKLASMAEGPAATPQDKVRAFNNSLDFMAIHDALLEQFNEDMGNPANFAVESRVRAITAARCAVPSDRPALQDLFQRILRQLLQGNTMTEEDAVDILSMKDNSAWSGDFVDALIILSNSIHMSEGRKRTATRNVWRRIYLHDNWKHIRDSANKADYELTANLRKTQVYLTLASPALPRNSVVSPSEAVEVPTSEEISLRWPGMAPNQVYELSQDFARESNVLSDHGPSEAEFAHVRRLVEEDIGHDSKVDAQ